MMKTKIKAERKKQTDKPKKVILQNNWPYLEHRQEREAGTLLTFINNRAEDVVLDWILLRTKTGIKEMFWFTAL